MSYDLMVFAPEAAPRKRSAFLDWYEAQTEWPEDHGYDDPALAMPALQAFYAELSETFPPVSEDNPEQLESGTDYTIGRDLIYISFLDWDRIDQAHETVYRLAAKHALGFFDVSSDIAEVWLPDNKEGLRVAHSD
ncbi:hypothetical protein LK540_22680 [Massilia sp. IC2-278]|uniref:hypothetical protein n=1 Tax=Massilia sp. IC2-278 TaxID=2887200 RepID=UPI001E30870C|nr:hypothetical protein [Massilia sp. IC2-278]MCC2963246.1 hypothetical protein [Massilia sp. IC2-278]